MDKDEVQIRFEGRTLPCRAGTSVAVALWENGIKVLSQSPKYGSPRGVTCARGHCTACLMRIDGAPNVRSCETEVRQGMVVQRQDAGTIYAGPLQKVLAAGAGMMPVGFYYKWFTKPAALSRLFLRSIRPLTGIGRLPDGDQAAPGPDEHWGGYDTVVVGAGPSGLAAAAATGGSLLLLDDHRDPGGQRLAALQAVQRNLPGGVTAFPILERALVRTTDARDRACAKTDLKFAGQVRAVAGFHPDGLLIRRGDRLGTVTFSRLIWAAGSLDVLGLFPGNDTPGLLGPRALYRLVTRDGLQVAGQRALLIGGGLDFWLSAALLAAGGAHLSLVVTEEGRHAEIAAAVDHKWPLHTGLVLTEVRSRGADLGVTLSPRQPAPGPVVSQLDLAADLVVVCRNGKPAYDIPYQLGAELTLQPLHGGFLPAGAGGQPACLTLPGGRQLLAVGEAAGLAPDQTDPTPQGVSS